MTLSKAISPRSSNKASWRHALLVILVLGALGKIFTLAPIPQDTDYHLFVDTRSYLGIPNGLNVLTNIPFLLIGILGLGFCLRATLGPARYAWTMLFVGLGLVSAGSAYYHWNPNNGTLFWDRLPITIGFMSLFAALIGEYVDQRLGKTLLLPAVSIGVVSVLYWHWTDDLRFYIWVQLFPLLTIPTVMLLFPKTYSHSWLLLAGFTCYVLAKVAEMYDGAVFASTANSVSGHSLKHLFAAAGSYCVYQMLRSRHAV